MLRENPHDYAAAEAWNRAHDVGIPVRYWPGLHEGDGIESTTRSLATVLGGHTAVVWVEGRPDCIALSHVEPKVEPRVTCATCGGHGYDPINECMHGDTAGACFDDLCQDGDACPGCDGSGWSR